MEALITRAGGKAFIFGHSSGEVLALEAARLLPTKIARLALYEPPFIIDDSRPPLPEDYLTHLTELVRSDHPGEAVEYYMNKAVGVPPEGIAQMQPSPMWPVFEAAAPTLIYDGTIMGDTMSGNPMSIKKWASATVPTLVMDGGKSPAFMHHGAQELLKILPHAQHRRLAGQDHGVAGAILAPVLVEFFK